MIKRLWFQLEGEGGGGGLGVLKESFGLGVPLSP